MLDKLLCFSVSAAKLAYVSGGFCWVLRTRTNENAARGMGNGIDNFLAASPYARARSLTKSPAAQTKAREIYNRLKRDLKILIACQFWRQEKALTFQSVDESL